MSRPKYPYIIVDLGDLNGPEGNSFVILGRVRIAMKKAGLTDKEINSFTDEARSGDYNHLLNTVDEYVTVREDHDIEDEFQRWKDEIRELCVELDIDTDDGIDPDIVIIILDAVHELESRVDQLASIIKQAEYVLEGANV